MITFESLFLEAFLVFNFLGLILIIVTRIMQLTNME